MSHLRLQNKAHEVCIELFLRVAQLCQIFAYRTKHTLCLESYFFGSLTYRHFCHVFAYRTRHTKCVVSCFFGSLSYVRSSITEQGTRSVYWVASSGRSVMSHLRLQKKAHAVCSELFLRVAQLSHIFDYRKRRTQCVVSCFFGSLTYVRSSLTEQSTRSL